MSSCMATDTSTSQISPLIDDRLLLVDSASDYAPPNQQEARSLFKGFVLMSVYFSLSHGCVVSVIDLSSNFGHNLGSYSVGTLYAAYVVTATLMGVPLISISSAKRVLVASMVMLSVYVSSYLLALIFPAYAWQFVLFGAGIGGIGSGLLWTAQGFYFKLAVIQYSKASVSEEKDTSSMFASIFACIYLGLEMALKVSGSLVARYGTLEFKYGLFAIYSAIAVAATLLMSTVRSLRPDAKYLEAEILIAGLPKVKATLKLLLTNPKCALMWPTNAAFGFAAAFIVSYVQNRYFHVSPFIGTFMFPL